MHPMWPRLLPMKRSQTPGSRTARVEDLDVDGDVEQRGRQDADHRAHHGAVAAVEHPEYGQPVRRWRVRDDLQFSLSFSHGTLKAE